MRRLQQLTWFPSLFVLILALVLWGGWMAPGFGRSLSSTPAHKLAAVDQIQRFRPQPGINFALNPSLAIAPTCPALPASELTSATATASGFQPQERVAPAHPTNYGDRVSQDINGQPVSHAPILVLHETVSSGSATIRFFQTPHPRESDQASYHALILRNGEVVYLVPPEKRAFGAGNSLFVGPNGPEAVKTHRKFAASVNNFAYHISLVTPADGNHNGRAHSGYSRAQYQSLAWLIQQTGVPPARITTHKAVDRSGERIDPRSFTPKLLAEFQRLYPPAVPGNCAIPSGT